MLIANFEIVKCLLHAYARHDVITQTNAVLMPYTQPRAMSPTQYDKLSMTKSL